MDYAGFHPQAIEQWGEFKKGYEHSGIEANSNLENSCYICFSPSATPANLAAESFRAVQLLDRSVELSFRLSRKFVVLLETSMLSNQAILMDILGGILFRKAENFIVVPESSDYVAFLRDFPSHCSQIQMSPSKLLAQSTLSVEAARELLRVILSVSIVRDLMRIFKLDNRPVDSSLENVIKGLLRTVPAYQNDLQDESSLNAFIDSAKNSLIDFELQNAWEVHVIEMYGRPAPRRVSKPMALRSRVNRKRKIVVAESDDEEMNETINHALVVDNWLQCDQCSKWRVVNSDIAQKFENEPFQCCNVGSKTCSDPPDDLSS